MSERVSESVSDNTTHSAVNRQCYNHNVQYHIAVPDTRKTRNGEIQDQRQQKFFLPLIIRRNGIKFSLVSLIGSSCNI